MFAVLSLMAILARLVSAWMGRRFTLHWPIAGIVLASALSIFGMAHTGSGGAFTLSFLTYGAVLYLAYPFYSTVASELDDSGSIAALLQAAQAIGAMLAPAVSGLVLSKSQDFDKLALANALLTLPALFAIIPVLKADRQFNHLRTMQNGVLG